MLTIFSSSKSASNCENIAKKLLQAPSSKCLIASLSISLIKLAFIVLLCVLLVITLLNIVSLSCFIKSCFVFGIGEVRSWSVYEWITAILPLQTDHYWFATAYVLMFMLSPVLAAGVKQLSKKQLEMTIGVLLLYFCVFKSISPILLSTDNYGYDYPWFICLYLMAAYIKLYGESDNGLQIGRCRLFTTAKKSAVVYISIALITFCGSLVLAMINARFGKVKYLMDMMFSYNHLLTLFSSLACFFAFKHWKSKEGRFTGFLCKIAPHTFGVYLIHENVAIRNEWAEWFRIGGIYESLWFVPYMLLVIVCIFAVCMLIDFVRAEIFRKVL
jgi:hypothetical protein